MARNLFTVGYQGTEIDSFIARLRNHAINCLLDVREVPLSRKRGFSKTALSEHLEHNNITYVHFRHLGSPKPAREKLKLDNDYEEFFTRIEEHLSDKQDAIDGAYAYVANNTCCLMCFERVADTCHRKIVADKIKERDGNGLTVSHI
jgi:uncharacterized protein (DUF488 family)